jgi:hypothetical protein
MAAGRPCVLSGPICVSRVRPVERPGGALGCPLRALLAAR